MAADPTVADEAGQPHRHARRRPVRTLLIGTVAVAVIAGGVIGGLTIANRLHHVTTGCSLDGIATQPDGTVRNFRFAPEQLSNAAAIASVAMRRHLPERAMTIAFAVAMQESKLRNLDYGDRDSLGLFQQRPSQGWGTAEQVQDPEFAAGAFFSALVKVRDWQDRPLTEVAQAVQRSGYPEAYAGWEPRGAALSAAFTGSAPAALACRIAEREPGTAPSDVRARLAHDLPGGTSAVTTLPDGRSAVRVQGLSAHGDPLTRPWTVANWGVAHTADLGVTEVWTAGKRWRASDGKWRNAGSSEKTASGEVVLVLAPVGTAT